MVCDNLWGHVWPALSTIGSIGASCVSLWLALRHPKEKVSGEWEPVSFWGGSRPDAIRIRLKNNGRTNVDLPDVLRVDFYMADSHWGEIYTSERINNFIPAKFYNYETTAELSDEQLADAVYDADMRIFTWTSAGTRIELKRHDIKINSEELGI